MIFDDLNTLQTFELNKYILDIGFELRLHGLWDQNTDYPDDFNITVTDSDGDISNVLLVRNPNDWQAYFADLLQMI